MTQYYQQKVLQMAPVCVNIIMFQHYYVSTLLDR